MADTIEATEGGESTDTNTSTPETKSESKGKAPNYTPKQRASFEDRMKRAASLGKVEAAPEMEEETEAQKTDENADDSAPAADKTPATNKKAKKEVKPFEGTPEERVAAASKALEEGNIKELVRVLGADAKLADASNEKYRVVRDKAKKVADHENKVKEWATTEQNRLQTLASNLKAQYGEPKKAAEAYKAGRYGAAASALQAWFGDDFATITKNIAKEIAGLSPEEKARLEERRKFEEEKAAWAREKAEASKGQTKQQKEEAALKTIETKCAGHDVMKIKGAAALILARMEQAWDKDLQGFRISFKQAADQILEEKLEELKALGLASPEAKPASKKESKPASSVVAVATEEPKYDGNGRRVRKSFEQRMEEARRITERTRAGR